MPDADVINMKKIIFFAILFLIYTAIICFCPVVTQWDRSIIAVVQDYLKDIPLWMPMLVGKQLYTISIYVPLIIGSIFFLRKFLLIDMVIFLSSPLVAYIFNKFFKIIIHRPRPPIELQIVYQPHGFSYVSNHAFITCTLWGLIIFYLIKYCNNKLIKYLGISFSILWILLSGFCRIWLGVHNPTDILGGYFLSVILLLIYVKIIRVIGGKC